MQPLRNQLLFCILLHARRHRAAARGLSRSKLLTARQPLLLMDMLCAATVTGLAADRRHATTPSQYCKPTCYVSTGSPEHPLCRLQPVPSNRHKSKRLQNSSSTIRHGAADMSRRNAARAAPSRRTLLRCLSSHKARGIRLRISDAQDDGRLIAFHSRHGALSQCAEVSLACHEFELRPAEQTDRYASALHAQACSCRQTAAVTCSSLATAMLILAGRH